MWKRRALLVLRVLLGAFFIYSGGAKLLDLAAFQENVANFDVVSWGMAGAVAAYLPWLEIICGGALVAKRQFFGGVTILSLLMVLFTLLVGSAWARGLDVSCGCFGASDATANYPVWVARNLVILTALVSLPWIGARLDRNRANQEPDRLNV